jgi:hypothetical protein
MNPLRISTVCLMLILVPARALGGSAVALWETELATVDEVIAQAQADLQEALNSHDEPGTRTAGNRLRDLKIRREQIRRAGAEARDQEDRSAAVFKLRERIEIVRRLDALKGQIDQAAADFVRAPNHARAAALRDLTIEQIKLNEDLQATEQAARRLDQRAR